jgi:hypothetical protein
MFQAVTEPEEAHNLSLSAQKGEIDSLTQGKKYCKLAKL